MLGAAQSAHNVPMRRAFFFLVFLLICAAPRAQAIFSDGFEGAAAPAAFHGTNLVGMEFFYGPFDANNGPVAGTDYPAFDTRLIDYFASKHVGALRFLFSWEGMQTTLMGPIPASNSGSYKAYYDNYVRIVDYATNTKGLTVIVTPWQASPGGIGGATYRGVLVGDPAVPVAAWSDFWTKIATIFKDNPRVRFALVTEPHDMSTMAWWSIAQAGITAIRASGATQRIYVPGNGYDAAGSWTDDYYDTAATPRSNAYGYLNANGVGQPIADPANNFAFEVHQYLDGDASGTSAQIVSAVLRSSASATAPRMTAATPPTPMASPTESPEAMPTCRGR